MTTGGDSGARDWGWDFEAMLPSVPGVVQLQADGFTPVESLFGQAEFARVWPEDHRREVRDTRFEQSGQDPWDEDDLRLFLVRSP